MIKNVLYVDLEGTNLRMAAVDCHGEILHRIEYGEIRTPQTNQCQRIIQAITGLAIECRKHSAKQREVLAVTVASEQYSSVTAVVRLASKLSEHFPGA